MQAPQAARAASSIRTTDSPAASATLPRSAVALFACASGLSVANVYYAQPLLDALCVEFAIGRAAIGGVMTATQIGCALALLLLVPLGDLVDRRRLMLVQSLALAATLTVVGIAPAASVLFAGMLGAGLFGTAMTQGLISYAASAAASHERGRVVGAAQGGVVIGLLLARVLAGVVSDLAGWRSVYFCSAATMLVLAALLWRKLPGLAPASPRIGYPRLIASLFVLLREARVLQIRGTIALLMFAAFNIFWNALVLPLSAPPYGFSHTAIGAFGLVGALGALAAARAGHWADRGFGQLTSGAALALLLASWLPLSLMPVSLWALVIGIVLLDIGGQAIHVTNQSMIFRARPDAHSRLVAVYMLFYSAGSGLGAIASTTVYATAGWRGVCMLGAAVSAAALAFWAATLRLMPGEFPFRDSANECRSETAR
ncbi:MFS transporter [Burkholderia mayonis]|uniref:MFS transporter n=1 Tax=Burkholderia mayonis TaxID=1385591 RepID=UPI000A748FB1|nr:MFS transporter [Burkholderia mayonis]